ncbi:MAG: hypothetical protein QUS09_02050 [Methanotrichaceae archaeon]|nr:hypothetical protein [Methanotrichaceae archaeon]
MKLSIISITIISILASSCAALPIQLGGDNGRAILENIAAKNTTNQTESLNATAPGDLWSWGTLPVGHVLNESGELVVLPTETDPTVTVPPARSSGI